MNQPRVPPGTVENRTVGFSKIEVRKDGDKLHFSGHAAVFDRLSEDLGGFRERIQRGAFRKVLERDPDVRFLLNHNPDTVLARTKANTMTLQEDPTGLAVEADLANTTLARDLSTSIERRDIDGMSFSFRVRPDGEDVWDNEGGELLRTIISFGDLIDVGPASFPAFPQTDATVRMLCGVQVFDTYGEPIESPLRELAWKIYRGELQASDEQRGRIDAALAKLETVSPWTAERVLRAVSQEPELQAVVQGMRVTVEQATDAMGGAGPYSAAARRRRLSMYTHVLRGD